jgi:hypothetical protein
VVTLAVILLVGLNQASLGGPTVVSGSFAGPNPFKVDAGFVTEYKDGIAGIADGSLVSRSLFLPSELSILDESPFEEGGSSYHVSIFDGLSAGDIVRTFDVVEFRFSSSEPWQTSSDEQEEQWVEIGSSTAPSTETISNFRDFIEETDSGLFRFVKGTGLFWFVEPGDNITGWELRVLREFEVIRGGTLVEPTPNSRGLIVGSGVSGGQSVLSGEFIGTAVAVPEPTVISMVALSALMLGGAVVMRRPWSA